MSGQNSNLFGSPVSGKSTSGAGFFGTSLSPLNGCSIFGDTGSDQSNQQQTTGPAEFSFSFGAKSPTTSDNTPNRSTAFSLFQNLGKILLGLFQWEQVGVLQINHKTVQHCRIFFKMSSNTGTSTISVSYYKYACLKEGSVTVKWLQLSRDQNFNWMSISQRYPS